MTTIEASTLASPPALTSLLTALTALAKGDATVRLPVHWDGVAGKVADALVPLQQSEAMVEKLKGAGVPAKLIVKPGAGHGWPGIAADVERIADWFDEHLKKGTDGGTGK